jgi:hypothetical protein
MMVPTIHLHDDDVPIDDAENAAVKALAAAIGHLELIMLHDAVPFVAIARFALGKRYERQYDNQGEGRADDFQHISSPFEGRPRQAGEH